MSEVERNKREHAGKDNSMAGYTTTAIGVALLVAAVLVIITAGTPAAGIGFVIGAGACLGWGVPRIMHQRKVLPTPVNREKELLSAIRDNGGSITPAEAAMETSLTIREADAMLSELASAGHVMVESRNNALFYSLPSREDPALEGSNRN